MHGYQVLTVLLLLALLRFWLAVEHLLQGVHDSAQEYGTERWSDIEIGCDLVTLDRRTNLKMFSKGRKGSAIPRSMEDILK